MKKYLNASEFCEIHGISKMTFYRHIKSGDIEHKRIGSRILVPADDEYGDDERFVALPPEPSAPQKNNIELFLDKLSPEIMKAFEDPPDFGSVRVEVTYHGGTPVKIDCGKSIKKRV